MSLGCLGHCKFSFLLNLMFTQFPNSIFCCLAIIINNNPFLFELCVSKQCRYLDGVPHLSLKDQTFVAFELIRIWMWAMWPNVMLPEGELFSL